MASSSRSSTLPAPPSTSRVRPISRRTAGSYDVHPYDHNRHQRTTSSSAMPFNVRPDPFTRPTSTPPRPVDPRFSRLLSTVLGSPFLTTVEPLPHFESDSMQIDSSSHSISTRPASPVPTVDFSIINVDPDDVEANPFIPGGYPSAQPRLISSPLAGLGFSRGRPMYANTSSTGWAGTSNNNQLPTAPQNSFKAFLPRLWDALSSPARSVMNFSSSANVIATPPPSMPSSRATSPSASRHLPSHSSYTNNGTSNGRHSPVYWNTNKGKGQSKAGAFFAVRSENNSRRDLSDSINYSELPPLDGEEGELIDDEACFIDARAITGIDILSLLPPELSLHILALLCPSNAKHVSNDATTSLVSPVRSSTIINEVDAEPHVALRALLACRLVSRTWCRLASDNAIWRALFLGRWKVDLRRASPSNHGRTRNVRKTLGRTWDLDMVDIGAKAKRVLGLSASTAMSGSTPPMTSAPLQLDWRILYRDRLELDLRWSGVINGPIFRDTDTTRLGRGPDRSSFLPASSKDLGAHKDKGWEPKLTRISGHFDSVYCLEFDSRRIITGSRDRTIKVWSLRTGALLATFVGVHQGSVLCLKFEGDWDRNWVDDDSDFNGDGGFNREVSSESPGRFSQRDDLASGRRKGRRPRKGFMVSGSSDCSVCVWDLGLGPVVEHNSDMDDYSNQMHVDDDGERQVTAEVRAVLKGHSGGVLDLRIDKQWIVSCSKDAVIRVWDRKTLYLHCTLRGHEGPVNAIGLRGGKVVSASGDGKMILWDIASGERLRTFEGHDRGLACIEFKDDLIVSGSNDYKIKVWSAATGECLRTLVGHKALVRALSFDPRSGRLVSASYDKSVKLWDLGTGKLVREFRGIHNSHIFDVKFDVARIVSASHDQKIVVLDFSAGLDAKFFV